VKKAILVLTWLFVATSLMFSQQPERKLTLTNVAGNVYQLTGMGGNMGALVGPDGVLLIDTAAGPVLPQIKQALAAVTDKPIRYVVITHYHFDHVGSNAQVSKEAPIIAHENVRQRMASEKKLPALNESYPPDAADALPAITYNGSMTIHINGEDVRLFHFANAHTDGDTVVYFPKSNVVHMGDELFAGSYPFVDVDNGGNVIGLADAVDMVLSLVPPDAKFIAGHGPVYTAAQMKDYSAFLKDSVNLVESAMKQGKTLDQMKTEGVLDKYDKMNGFIKTPQFTDFVYRSLQDRKKAPIAD